MRQERSVVGVLLSRRGYKWEDVDLGIRLNPSTSEILTDTLSNLPCTAELDEEAFRVVYESYGRSIIRFIYGMVGEATIAEELMQETFVRAYRERKKLRNSANPSAWVFGIARNVALNAIRSNRIRSEKVIPVDLDHRDYPAIEPSPVDQLLARELDSVINRALRTLTIDKRLVFVLKVLQQMSYEEIVEITGHPISKLKTDLHRAKREMRSIIRPYLEKRK